ncbi:acetoin utilization protein AcuC [Pengzhenrongella frigida]|uniref:Acetoin utilization protein AcuC n=1 Tax=Pengzhenrongella frigida TaxID=1259133 RepID=A0A4Q5MWV8_9MICO|nr:acetoin utilization protein AcuC [Cellulomonas sp. HLT2-17]RYV50065.1 acetoin utilization protein AcuC [Cellulomonas sp. HLT2-17]
MAESVHIVWSPALLGYDFGQGHPMSPARLKLTMDLAGALGLLEAPGVEVVGVEPATDAELLTVHAATYVAAVRAASDHGVADWAHGLGTEDDPVFPGMHEAAARVVAGSLAGANAVWSGDAVHAVNITGGMHHAMPESASGFCVYNDAAVAIRRLLADGARRVAYVDVDAHHGDGVEHIFWDDPRVLTVSVHESGRSLFPGTGHAAEVGGDGAEGTAVNLALPAGTGDAGWLRAIDAVVPAVLRGFAPDVIVSQHGCDTHAADPIANLRVSIDAQRHVAGLVHDLAHEVADGRWLALGGGGYAVIDVVPRAWSQLIAIAGHVDLDPATALPDAWRQDVIARWGRTPPERMTDGASGAFREWGHGYDPADDVDRAIRATRDAVFPHLGLDPNHD